MVGRPPFDPAVLLKVELLAYLYDLSERQVETYLNENLPAKSLIRSKLWTVTIMLPMSTSKKTNSDRHFYLELHGLHSAIRLKKTYTHKKDASRDLWLALQQTQPHHQGLKECYKIERKFGEAKQWHGLGHCRHRVSLQRVTYSKPRSDLEK